jgi:hypothetical protein
LHRRLTQSGGEHPAIFITALLDAVTRALSTEPLTETTIMNKFKDKKKGKREQQGRPASAPTRPAPTSSIRRWLAAVALIAIAGGGSYAAFHHYVLTRVPLALVGTWVVMDVRTTGADKSNEALKGGRMYFHRDGRMVVQANMDGKGYTIKATVEVEDDILRITSVNPSNGQTATDVQTIRTLEGDRFVIEDSKGTTLMMERLRE